jgi:uncharacterized protein (TIGR02145 family)
MPTTTYVYRYLYDHDNSRGFKAQHDSKIASGVWPPPDIDKNGNLGWWAGVGELKPGGLRSPDWPDQKYNLDEFNAGTMRGGEEIVPFKIPADHPTHPHLTGYKYNYNPDYGKGVYLAGIEGEFTTSEPTTAEPTTSSEPTTTSIPTTAEPTTSSEPTTTLEDFFDCNYTITGEYQPSETNPLITNLDVGEGLGFIKLNYDNGSTQVRYILKYDGNVVIDTFYRGLAIHSYGGTNRSDITYFFDGKVDPITGITYPYQNPTGYPDMAPDGYPEIFQPSVGTVEFEKTTVTPTTATLEIYNHHPATLLNVSVECVNEGQPEPTTTEDPTTVSCDSMIEYDGGPAYPEVVEVDLGTGTGFVGLYYDVHSVPDRYIVKYDGNIVIDTFYVGNSRYAFGGVDRGLITAGWTDLIDPITGIAYPYPNPEAYPDIAPDGYPEIMGPPIGLDVFEKTTPNPTTATVEIYGPYITTIWNFTMTCTEQTPPTLSPPQVESCANNIVTHPRWDENNEHWGDDYFGLGFLPGSFRGQYGEFGKQFESPLETPKNVGSVGLWWGITGLKTMEFNSSAVSNAAPVYYMRVGASVRAVRDTVGDERYLPDGYVFELNSPQSYVDGSGWPYRAVKIGYQVWIKTNLWSTAKQNGTQIPWVTDNNVWVSNGDAEIGSCCYFMNDGNYYSIYGMLYNGYALDGLVSGNGWRVASMTDFNQLTQYIERMYHGQYPFSNMARALKSCRQVNHPNAI